MPPGRPRKQQSNESMMSMTNSITVTMKTPSPERTPEQGVRRPAGPVITAAQKQALIENLQLEVTDRARKLRSIYALHAQGLRSRLEMRVNRIPQGLRSTNILDLIIRHSEEPSARARSPPKRLIAEMAIPIERPMTAPEPLSSPPRSRGTKRPSGDISTESSEDKENVDADLDMPKKRTKTAANATQGAGNGRPARTASRKVAPSQVLSPKSNNSRPPARAPARVPASPPKTNSSRPISQLKTAASAPNLGERPKAPPRTTSRHAVTGPVAVVPGPGRGRRVVTTAVPAAAEQRRGRVPSSGSNASDTSAGTTIVTRKTAPATTARKGTVTKKATTTTATKKAAGTKRETVAPAGAATTASGRTLRSRR